MCYKKNHLSLIKLSIHQAYEYLEILLDLLNKINHSIIQEQFLTLSIIKMSQISKNNNNKKEEKPDIKREEINCRIFHTRTRKYI